MAETSIAKAVILPLSTAIPDPHLCRFKFSSDMRFNGSSAQPAVTLRRALGDQIVERVLGWSPFLMLQKRFAEGEFEDYGFATSDKIRWTMISASGPAPMIRADARLRCHGRPTR